MQLQRSFTANCIPASSQRVLSSERYTRHPLGFINITCSVFLKSSRRIKEPVVLCFPDMKREGPVECLEVISAALLQRDVPTASQRLVKTWDVLQSRVSRLEGCHYRCFAAHFPTPRLTPYTHAVTGKSKLLLEASFDGLFFTTHTHKHTNYNNIVLMFFFIPKQLSN